MQLVKEVIHKKGFKVKDVAKEIGINPQSLTKSLNNITLPRLIQIATIIGVNVHELIEPGIGYNHLYNKDSKWYGITPEINK